MVYNKFSHFWMEETTYVGVFCNKYKDYWIKWLNLKMNQIQVLWWSKSSMLFLRVMKYLYKWYLVKNN
jgi:hypothetical protein